MSHWNGCMISPAEGKQCTDSSTGQRGLSRVNAEEGRKANASNFMKVRGGTT